MAIALAGRPNVGKSSLFNRLVGRRHSLVWNQPGVTRDIIQGRWKNSKGHFADLWDLAGWGKEGLSFKNIFEDQISQIEAIILVVDGSEPLTSEDLECIEKVRKLHKPLFVAVNKADKSKTFSLHSHEIYEYFAPESVFFISAEANSGLEDLEDTLETFFKEEESEEDSSDEADSERVLILGRPNVGKSSLMNKILGKTISFVADQPGTTRDTLEASLSRKGTQWTFMDSAGVRKKSKVYGRKSDPIEIFSVEKALKQLRYSDLALFVIEASQTSKLHSQDRKLLHLLRSSHIPAIILVNKWDLVRKDWKEEDYRQNLKDQLGDLHFLPILFVSAKTGFHLEKIFQLLNDLRVKLRRRIPTPKLNRWLQRILLLKPPRVAKRGMKSEFGRTPTRYLHIQYVVQTGQRPMSIQFFCNAPHAVAEDDRRFLESRLRDEFGLVGIPIKIGFRKKN